MAQKAPRDALKEAQKLENWTRLQNQSQKLGATRTKNTRYAAGMVKVDLIRASLGPEARWYLRFGQHEKRRLEPALHRVI